MKLNLKFTTNEYRNIASDLLSSACEQEFNEGLRDELYSASDALRDLAGYIEHNPEHKYIYDEGTDSIILESFTMQSHDGMHECVWHKADCVWYDETEDDESYYDDWDFIVKHMEPIEYERELVLPEGCTLIARSHRTCIALIEEYSELVAWNIQPNGEGVVSGDYFPMRDGELPYIDVFKAYKDKIRYEF